MINHVIECILVVKFVIQMYLMICVSQEVLVIEVEYLE